MIVLDRMLVGGIKFVLQKVAAAVEAEMNDETALREELLAAQMRLELGEIDEAGFQQIEAAVLAGLREIRRRKSGGEERGALSMTDLAGAQVEASLEHSDEE